MHVTNMVTSNWSCFSLDLQKIVTFNFWWKVILAICNQNKSVCYLEVRYIFFFWSLLFQSGQYCKIMNIWIWSNTDSLFRNVYNKIHVSLVKYILFRHNTKYCMLVCKSWGGWWLGGHYSEVKTNILLPLVPVLSMWVQPVLSTNVNHIWPPELAPDRLCIIGITFIDIVINIREVADVDLRGMSQLRTPMNSGARFHQHPWYDFWSGSVSSTIPVVKINIAMK